MGLVFGTVAALLVVILLWGLFAPRSQWRMLRAWSVSDPHRDEPGGAVYGWLRLISGIGVISMALVGVVGTTITMANVPRSAPPPSAVEQMWGKPDPQLLNRVSVNLTTPPAGLAEFPVLGYQDFDDGIPNYVLDLDEFALLGKHNPPGIVGREPDKGSSGIGASNLLVHVRGPLLCIPRELVVLETETTVQVGVFYGLPDDPEDKPLDHVASCPAGANVSGSLLIPVQLSGPMLDRELQNLQGEPIEYVTER